MYLQRLLAFAVGVLLTKNLLVGAALSFVASLVVMVALVVPPTKKMASLKPTFDGKQITKLLVTTAPLFAGSFLLTYVVGAPRYALGGLSDKHFLRSLRH